jgi:hypothetical protein
MQLQSTILVQEVPKLFVQNGKCTVDKPLKTEGLKNVKVKVKFTLEQATKAQKGSGGIALLFL